MSVLFDIYHTLIPFAESFGVPLTRQQADANLSVEVRGIAIEGMRNLRHRAIIPPAKVYHALEAWKKPADAFRAPAGPENHGQGCPCYVLVHAAHAAAHAAAVSAAAFGSLLLVLLGDENVR